LSVDHLTDEYPQFIDLSLINPQKLSGLISCLVK